MYTRLIKRSMTKMNSGYWSPLALLIAFISLSLCQQRARSICVGVKQTLGLGLGGIRKSRQSLCSPSRALSGCPFVILVHPVCPPLAASGITVPVRGPPRARPLVPPLYLAVWHACLASCLSSASPVSTPSTPFSARVGAMRRRCSAARVRPHAPCNHTVRLATSEAHSDLLSSDHPRSSCVMVVALIFDGIYIPIHCQVICYPCCIYEPPLACTIFCNTKA